MLKYIFIVLMSMVVSAQAQVYRQNQDGSVSLFTQDGVMVDTYQYTTNCLNGTCQQFLVPYRPYLYIAPEPRIQGNLPPTYYQPQYGPQGQNRTLEPNLGTPLVGPSIQGSYGLNIPNSTFNITPRTGLPQAPMMEKDDRLKSFRVK